MIRKYTDRSRIEDYQRCHRLRYWRNEYQGIGIESVRKDLPLAVGGGVHAGLEVLLHWAISLGARPIHDVPPAELRNVENLAVQAALAEFSSQRLNLPDAEQLAPEADLSGIDAYLAKEQGALIEGIVRAYARRRLVPLLSDFEVLEVEREGTWKLSEFGIMGDCGDCNDTCTETGPHIHNRQHELYFMSRPDALLLGRADRQLYLQSYKTTGDWDRRKAADAQHDMQGISEGVEVERRLADWWERCRALGAKYHRIVEQQVIDRTEPITPRMASYLRECDSAPRILAIRYEFLLKGERWYDKDLSARLGHDARVQRSHLIRGYLQTNAGDDKWNWSWDYLKPDAPGETSKLNYRAWQSTPIWEHMPISQWITMLDETAMAQSGDTGADLGYKSDAQTTGYTREHPLDKVFLPPMIVYRNEDDVRDWIDQVEAQERAIAEAAERVNHCQDEGERRHLLNVDFGMTRRACCYPTTCSMAKICWGSEEIQRDPLASGLYRVRVPNHPQERSNV